MHSGGIPLLIGLLSDTSTMTQKHSACALWGLASEGNKESAYNKQIIDGGAVRPLMHLLRDNHAETRGFAAACLSCLCKDEEAQALISEAGGAETLLGLAHGPATWLRSQAVEMLHLLGIPIGDPNEYEVVSPPQSPGPFGPNTARGVDGEAASGAYDGRRKSGTSPTSSPAITRRSTPMTSTVNTARTYQSSATNASNQTFQTKMKFHFFSFQVNHITSFQGFS